MGFVMGNKQNFDTTLIAVPNSNFFSQILKKKGLKCKRNKILTENKLAMGKNTDADVVFSYFTPHPQCGISADILSHFQSCSGCPDSLRTWRVGSSLRRSCRSNAGASQNTVLCLVPLYRPLCGGHKGGGTPIRTRVSSIKDNHECYI